MLGIPVEVLFWLREMLFWIRAFHCAVRDAVLAAIDDVLSLGLPLCRAAGPSGQHHCIPELLANPAWAIALSYQAFICLPKACCSIKAGGPVHTTGSVNSTNWDTEREFVSSPLQSSPTPAILVCLSTGFTSSKLRSRETSESTVNDGSMAKGEKGSTLLPIVEQPASEVVGPPRSFQQNVGHDAWEMVDGDPGYG
eukprot:gene7178-284_t